MRRTPEYLLGLAVLTAVYYGAAELGTSLAFADNATTVWPPVGILAAVVTVWGFRWLPAVAAGEIVATLVWGTPAGVAALQLVGNVAEVALFAFIMRSLCGGRPQFKTLRDVGIAIAAAVPAAIVSATVGVFALSSGDLLGSESFWTAWYRWVLADIASLLLFVPLVAVAVDSRGAAIARRHPLETVTVAVLTIAFSIAALVISDVPLTYAVFPVLAWAALRLGRLGAASAGFIAAAIAVAGVAADEGPFASRTSEQEALILAQTFVVVAALTTLALAIINSQRLRAANERAASLAELQAILSAAPAVIFVKDLAGRYKLASDHLRRIWGDNPVVGQTDADLMPPEAAAAIEKSDRQLIETREIVDVEGIVPEPRGERIYRVQRFPVIGPDDDVRGIGGIALDVTEQREGARQLARSEELLARTAELGRVGGWEYDVATERFSWSAEMYSLHGVDPDSFEVSLESWTRLTHPDDLADALETFRLSLERGGPDTWESRRRTIWPNGEVRVLLMRGQVRRDESGASVGMTGFDQDITELAAAEEERRRSEELLERTAELGRIGGWEMDVATRKYTWSAQMYVNHGVDPETFEVTDSSWMALFHPDDRAESTAAVLAAASPDAANRRWEMRRRVIHPDGSVRVLHGHGRVHLDEDGKPVRLSGFDQDVTDLVAAEDERRRAEELMERIAELGRVGGWELDVATARFIWSPELYRIHGVDPESFQVTSATWMELLHPDDFHVRQVVIDAISDPTSDGWHARRRIIRPDGEVRVLDGRGVIERDAEGNAVQLTGYDQDVTELAALEEERRRSEELLARTAELGRVGGWEMDLETRVLTWSAEVWKIYGVDPATFDLTLENWSALVVDDQRDEVMGTIRGAIETGGEWERRSRVVRPDGRRIVTHSRGHVEVDRDGAPVRLVGFEQDVTELARAEEEMARGRDLLERTAEIGSVGGWEIDIPTGELTWSAQQYRIYGLDPDEFELTNDSWGAMVHPDDRERAYTVAQDVLENGGSWSHTVRIIRSDGEVRHIRGAGEVEQDAAGNPVVLRGFQQDVTDLVAAEEELRLAEHRYRSLVERLPAVSYVCEAGPNGQWRYVSPQIERMLGYTPEEWIADPTLWERCLHPDDRERVIEVERHGVATGAPMAIEYRMQARDGRTLWLRDEALVRPDAGKVYLDGMLTDITERKAFETQLQFLADHDPLTGLYNRRRFVEELAMESKIVLREGHCSTVVMLDLDNFKYINDALGHRAGDVLIRGIADTLERRLRETDTLARLGGDEFAALLRGSSPEEARAVVTELLEAIRERTHALSDEPVRVTASAGMVALDDNAASAEELLAFADLAMYEAKQTGRDRVAVFSPELHHEVRSGRSWADRIRSSLEGGGFELFCQPIVDLSTDAVSQWEVLLRMRGDDGKIVAPDAFLPLAERFDLIQQIDRWVALEAIALMEQRLRVGERVRLEVNLSAKSLVDPDFMAAVEAAVRSSSIEPSDLIFEVTETAAIANMDEARAFSERLRRLGCGFALDDFGSGFASFYYLKHLPVDYVKIDGDFVRGLTASAVDQQVVKAMIAIAKALGQKTVAEFVGDQPTVELLRTLGVDYVQGYYLGVPVPVDRMTGLPAPQPPSEPARLSDAAG